jgi:hypothetical protein
MLHAPTREIVRQWAVRANNIRELGCRRIGAQTLRYSDAYTQQRPFSEVHLVGKWYHQGDVEQGYHASHDRRQQKQDFDFFKESAVFGMTGFRLQPATVGSERSRGVPFGDGSPPSFATEGARWSLLRHWRPAHHRTAVRTGTSILALRRTKLYLSLAPSLKSETVRSPLRTTRRYTFGLRKTLLASTFTG